MGNLQRFEPKDGGDAKLSASISIYSMYQTNYSYFLKVACPAMLISRSLKNSEFIFANLMKAVYIKCIFLLISQMREIPFLTCKNDHHIWNVAGLFTFATGFKGLSHYVDEPLDF